MRSKELADLAGVTVRALRHYHQLGILPEPPRAKNGYREYGAVDLARVLRIKRLSSLGISLQQVAEMLAEEQDSAGRGAADGAQVHTTDDALADLDRELAAQIEHLQRKRRIIAELRERAIDPDVPPVFGEHLARLRGAGASSGLVDYERSGLLLVDRFFDESSEEAEAVSQFFELAGEAGSVEAYVEFNERMLNLPPDASDEECERLADDFVSFMVPILKLGCEKHGWDLSAEKIKGLSCSPDFPFSLQGSENARVKSERPKNGSASSKSRAVAAESSFSEEGQVLDLLLDLYDEETLNDAQRRMNDLVVRGILSELAKG